MPKNGQNLKKMGHISNAISPTDFILGTKKSGAPGFISLNPFDPQNSYLVPSYNPIRCIQ